MTNQDVGGLEAILRMRREKAERLAADGWPSFPNGFEVEHTIADVRADEEDTPTEITDDATRFSVAGRLLSIRDGGKNIFADLWDTHGKVQLMLHQKTLGEEAFGRCKQLDIGDHLFVTGPRFRTRSNELTLRAETAQLASKSMYPLPDIHAGLTDVEQRYRRRYVDLVVNRETRDVFVKRAKLIQYIRKFLDDRDFLEVETPMLHSLIGGAAAKPFTTHHNALDMDLFCRIAPELYLKRLLVGGFDRVYEIGRNFRNEGLSTRHNPEFTMLEFYWAYATYETLMDATESMLRGACAHVTGSETVTYGDHTLDFSKPFARVSVRDGILAKIPGLDLSDGAAVVAAAKSKGLELNTKLPVGKMQMDLFEHLWEPELIQPTFVVDFPVEVSPLARKKASDPTLTDRFELYVAGREIANAFSELNDPDDQRARFAAQMEAKRGGAEEAMDYDEDYCHALEIGMPPAAGEGVGIDRLVMLFTNSPSIRDVILFPQMRPVAGTSAEPQKDADTSADD